MAVVKMLNLTALGPREEVERLALWLVLREDFQPIPVDALVTDRAIREQIDTSGENPCDSLLERLAAVWEAAGEPLPEPAPVPLCGGLALESIKEEAEEVLQKLERWGKRREILRDRGRTLEAARILQEALQGLDWTASDLVSLERFKAFFGHIREEDLSRLEESARDVPLLIVPLTTAGGRSWIMTFSLPDYAESAGKLLGSLNFRPFDLARLGERFAAGGMKEIQRRIKAQERALERLRTAAKVFVHEKAETLGLLYSRLFTLQRVYELCRGRGEVGGLYVLSGWVPAYARDGIFDAAAKEAPETAVHIEEPPPGTRKVPTFLKNLPFVRAFQDIVALYSLPDYGGADPSLLVAASFCLMFGFMFGDVGHGLLLVLAAHLLVRTGRMRRSMGLVVESAGAFSVIFGFLYGSVFGMEGLIEPLWFSPMENMDFLLRFSLGAGAFFITLGMVLNIYQSWREGDYGRMFFDGQGLAGVVFYWTAGLAIFARLSGRDLPVPGWSLASLLVLLLAAMLLKGLLTRKLLKAPSHGEGGVVQLFEVLHVLFSFMSNTASFIRLAAFTVNHVGLSLAVFMLADLVRELPGGPLFRLVIIAVGTLIIVGLEGLIVFIQTLRLEYYEFFSKFYRGGGDPFRPVRWREGAPAGSRSWGEWQ